MTLLVVPLTGSLSDRLELCFRLHDFDSVFFFFFFLFFFFFFFLSFFFFFFFFSLFSFLKLFFFCRMDILITEIVI